MAGGLGLVLWLAAYFRVITIPAAIALVLSATLKPVVDRLNDRLPGPRGVTTFVVFLTLLGGIGGGLTLLGAVTLPDFGEILRTVKEALEQLAQQLRALPQGIGDDLADAVSRPMDALNAREEGDRLLMVGPALSAIEVFTQFLLTLAFAFFFVKDGNRLWDAVAGLFPATWQDRLSASGGAAFQTMGFYIFGVAAVGLIDAILFGTALRLIGVPGVLPIAVLTFFSAFIPFVGPIIMGGVATAVGFVKGGLVMGLWAAGAAVVVQQIEGNVLNPYIMGRAVRLHPVVVLASITGAAFVAGIVGAFLVIPYVAAFHSARQAWLNPDSEP